MEPPSSSSISVVDESGQGFEPSTIIRAVAVALSQQGASNQIVCVLLTTDDAIQALNAQHRGADEVTDVLTFPAGEFPHAPLGDIAISVPYAERQANERGVPVDQELAYLAIHGALHLCGLNDEDEDDRVHMVAEMNRAAIAAGLAPDHDWYSLLHHTASRSAR